MADSSIITSNFKGFERNLTPSITVCQCELAWRSAPFIISHLASDMAHLNMPLLMAIH